MNRFAKAVIAHSVQARLIEQCRARAPYESCGVLFGAVSEAIVRAEGFAFVRNVAAEPERSFRFDPEEWIQVCYRAQKNQRSIVGFFHSHPYGPDHPSREDAEGLNVSGSVWIADLSRQENLFRVYERLPAERTPEGKALAAWCPVPLMIENDQ